MEVIKDSKVVFIVHISNQLNLAGRHPRHALQGKFFKDKDSISGGFGTYIEKDYTEYLNTGDWYITQEK